ncbi:hypothetical protein RND81_05G056000 [Saponaria officinalis]|uniref:Trichome birefringence-like N-terminal domain-containing protein n=1 Tax=Saponaria officinalis TaxID=3572 RepID=A0AAW1KV46_SAPOF
MSPLTNTQLSKTLLSKTQIISITFIILFTFIFILNFPSKFNPLHSPLLASHIFSLVTSTITTQNTSLVTRVDNRSSLISSNKKSSCDIFDGSWVYDDSGPVYAPGSCPYVGGSFNCYKSGRPDFGYLNYRWQPYGCDIPRFDGKKMMEMLRGKRMVFAGDSLNRNMWESLICSLGAFNVTGMRFLKRDGFSFEIKDYDCSITMITAPFLVRHWKTVGPTAIQTPMDKLRLDEIHDTIAKYSNAEFLIFNTGQWWNPARTKNGENFFQEGDVYVYEKMDVEEAYMKAMNTWAHWIDNTVDKNKTKVFFLGLSAVHFTGGQWYSNGTCETKEPIKDTEPIKGQVLEPYRPWIKSTPELEISKMKTPVIYLNITRLTDYRKDGHPSRYRRPGSKWIQGISQDCMHWCLPGVPDSWNQLLYTSLFSSLP